MPKRYAKPRKKSPPGRLRIVAGKWRSRLLQIAAVPGLRPTSERIRETLFNWLAPRLAGARCLDLFAGTGALGLEALSRGAAESVFVELSPQAVATLKNNIAELEAHDAVVHECDALTFLKQTSRERFDILFLDTPFAADMLGDLCRLLAESSILAREARIYIEDDRARPEVLLPKGWEVIKTKNAGNVRYSLVSVSTVE